MQLITYLYKWQLLTTIYIIKRSWVLKQDPGDENERDFRLYLRRVLALLKAEYRLLFTL
jgi:hypothetical protein